MASSLLQEESSYLYLTREISLQQMTKTMLISCMSDSRSLERKKLLAANSRSIIAMFVDLLQPLLSILASLNGEVNTAMVL